MKHPQYDLLIAAANDVDARFTCSDWNNSQQEIQTVLNYPKYDWKLVDKFAELKKAYAEGKQIQYRYRTGGNPTPQYMWSGWEDTIGEPQWDAFTEYRVKPEPFYEWQWLCRAPDGLFFASAFFTCPPAYTYTRIEDSKREVKL